MVFQRLDSVGADDPFEGFGIPTVTIVNGVASHPRTVRYDRDTSRRHLERAVELRSIHLGPNDRTTLEAMRQLGKTHLSIDVVKAFQVLREGLERSTSTFGPDDGQTILYQESIAAAYGMMEKPDEAVRIHEDVYTRSVRLFGADSSDTLNRSDKLAVAYEKAERIDAALQQWRESLRGRRNTSGSSDGVKHHYALRELARLYEMNREDARAELMWREAVKFDFGNQHEEKVSLALCLLRTGKYADAEPILREEVAWRIRLSPDAWTTLNTKSLLGGALLGQKKYADAEPLLRAGYEGMKQREKTIPPEGKVRIPEALDRLIELFTATNKPDEAKKWQAERAKYLEVAPPLRENK